MGLRLPIAGIGKQKRRLEDWALGYTNLRGQGEKE